MRITDHKLVGLLYAATASLFLLTGFALIMALRWQLAYPGSPVPIVGGLLGADNAPAGILSPEFYNQLGAMHGTIMIFLAVVPLAVGGFGTYLIPLMLGARDMALPRLSLVSYCLFAAAGVVMIASFFVPGGAANNGWTSYAPLSVLARTSGQTYWLVGMVLVAASNIAAAINIIVTIVQERAPGMTFMRMPFFLWAQLVTAFLLLLAFPPLEVAALMQLMDRLAGTSFFLPTGLVVNGTTIPYAGGGNPLLWQHLFWFLAHPEVYVLILPAMGIVAEVLTANIRKPLWGYRLMVQSAIFLGFVSMLVWAHHMFLTGMGTTMSAFFQTTTMIVSIPSVVILSALFVSLHGGSIRFTTPALFAIAFLPMFGIGGLTGLPLGLAASDIHLHDTYYVVGHFHYIVAPGTIFALFAGVYHWYPRVTGRRLGETLGRIHFWGSFICMNAIFFPMFIQGLAGLNRRLYDGGVSYTHGQSIQHWNVVQGWAAWTLGLVQLVFIANLLLSLRRRALAGSNPWRATTLEWTPATPQLAIYRGAYEYSVPGAIEDFTPQSDPDPDAAIPGTERAANGSRRDTGTTNIALATWLFLASEAMLFGGLLSTYVLLRAGSSAWTSSGAASGLGWVCAAALILVAVLMTVAGSSNPGRQRSVALLSAGVSVAYLAATAYGYSALAGTGHLPSTNNSWAVFYLLTSALALHVLAGGCVGVWAGTTDGRQSERFRDGFRACTRVWQFIALAATCVFVALYL